MTPMDLHTKEELESLLKAGDLKNEMLRLEYIVKKNGYDKLTDMELLAEAESVYQYGRYLRRTDNDFTWRGEEVPQGLLHAISENEDLHDALNFEIERRKKTEKTDTK